MSEWTSAGASTAWSAASRSAVARTAASVGAFFKSFGARGAFAEGVEAIGECHHHVACERVVAAVADVVGCYAALDVAALAEDVVGLKCYGCCFAAQELI